MGTENIAIHADHWLEQPGSDWIYNRERLQEEAIREFWLTAASEKEGANF